MTLKLAPISLFSSILQLQIYLECELARPVTGLLSDRVRVRYIGMGKPGRATRPRPPTPTYAFNVNLDSVVLIKLSPNYEMKIKISQKPEIQFPALIPKFVAPGHKLYYVNTMKTSKGLTERFSACAADCIRDTMEKSNSAEGSA